jgi:hypothetical protein
MKMFIIVFSITVLSFAGVMLIKQFNSPTKIIKQTVLSTLRDPESAKFGPIAIQGQDACITVNAKNGYGGYTGEQGVWLHQNNQGVWFVRNTTAINYEVCKALILAD